MRRRTFLSALAATAGGTAAGIELTGRSLAATGQIPEVEFYSTSSMLNANNAPLTDDSYVAAWAENTATNGDADGTGNAVIYGDDTPIPLVASDWNVVGFGSMLVTDADSNWQKGNEEFVLNVWDDALDGSGTVLWDEGHGQYYTRAKSSEFATYAENNGYTVTATSSLSSDLSGADAAVITSPGNSFTTSELSALGDFVANGGYLFLHDQSDYGNYDSTANLNDVVGYLDLAFRFNDDEVTDNIQNAGNDYAPVTTQFNTAFNYFSDRDGLGLDPNKTYTVPVEEVLDGDTVKVTVNGTVESIRILGLDTPEKSANSQYERIQEWEGIEDNTYLEAEADKATTFGKNELSGGTVDLVFDPNEPVRDAFGRVLGYLYYDSGSGSRDTLYNHELVKNGHARVYDSGFSKHDQFLASEATARANGTNVWSESDPANTPEIRDNPVGDLFFPQTASVRTTSGALSDSRVPVYAASSASQTLDGGYSYGDDIPLVGVDESSNVAVVGGPFVDEGYESGEGYSTDTSTYENYPFLTNLVDYLSDNSGDVLIDGGHGQFNAGYGLSAEDAAYYMRYLEGQDIGFEGVNEFTSTNLSGARAVVVTTPPEAFTQSEIDALSSYAANGGAVVLMGSGKTTSEARSNINTLASGLGTDLRVNADKVTDSSSNVGSSSDVPATSNFDSSFPLFDAYTPGTSSDYSVSIPTISEDGSTLNDEYVDITNDGSSALDMTGWTLEDAANHSYAFPDGFSLSAGSTVRVHSGSGTDSASDLYWGRGSSVWNNDSDTASVYDGVGNLAAEKSYPNNDSDSEIAVKTVNPDGSTLNDEYVDFENTSSSDQDMTGWTVEDEAGNGYQFPDGFTLASGDTVRLHSGDGTDSSTDLYWGGSYIWNNGGDTVYLFDGSGTQHTTYSY